MQRPGREKNDLHLAADFFTVRGYAVGSILLWDHANKFLDGVSETLTDR
jgi:hypothetical protein